MSKQETIESLIEHAMQVFSEKGYDHASVREIAGRANVSLGTIHHYFTSKEDLFRAVVQRATEEVGREWSAGLSRLRPDRGGSKVRLEDIVRAVVEPVVFRVRSDRPASSRVPKLIRWGKLGPEDLTRGLDRVSLKLINAITTACPNLSMVEAIWGYSFVISSLYCRQLMDNRFEQLAAELGVPDAGNIDAERIVEYVVAFAVGGLNALAAYADRSGVGLQGRERSRAPKPPSMRRGRTPGAGRDRPRRARPR